MTRPWGRSDDQKQPEKCLINLICMVVHKINTMGFPGALGWWYSYQLRSIPAPMSNPTMTTRRIHITFTKINVTLLCPRENYRRIKGYLLLSAASLCNNCFKVPYRNCPLYTTPSLSN